MPKTVNNLDAARTLAMRWGVSGHDLGSPSSLLASWGRVAYAAEKIARERELDAMLTANLAQLTLSIDRIAVRRLPHAKPDPDLLAVAVALENAAGSHFDKAATERNLVSTAEIVAGSIGRWLEGEARWGTTPIPWWEKKRMKREDLTFHSPTSRHFHRADFDETVKVYNAADMRMIMHLSAELQKSQLPLPELAHQFRDTMATWEREAHKHVASSPSTYALNHVATIEYGFAALHSHLLGRAAKEGLLHPADVETALTTTAASMDAWKALAVEVRDIGWSTNTPMSISFLETYKTTEHAIANSVKVLEHQDLIPLIGVLNTHVAVAYDLSAHLAEVLETTDLEAPKAAIRRLAPEAGLFPSKQAQARHPGKFQKVAVLPQELIDKLVEKTDHIRVAHDKSVPSLIRFDAFHRPGYRTPTPFQRTSSPPPATRNGPAL